jgi:fructosamine-3-kinase
VNLPAGARTVRALSGGSINEASQVVLADATAAFVKSRADASSTEYANEAAGLAWLAEADALRVPAVIEVTESYLVLEWIEQGQLDRAGEETLGRGLARLHAAGAPTVGIADGEIACTFGSLRLPNDPSEDWPSFYAERRLVPLIAIALERHSITEECGRELRMVCERIGDLCGPPEPPARLHGDLWHGNVLSDTHGSPWLIDPSAYGGHREVDLAMLRLFGSPIERVFAAYEEVAPLSDGWSERVELWQLAPLLVHAALFGGSYGQAVAQIAHRYGGRRS